MWDLPRPGLEHVSPASAGRFSTRKAPPGKPPHRFLKLNVSVMDKSIQEALFADRGGREREKQDFSLPMMSLTSN